MQEEGNLSYVIGRAGLILGPEPSDVQNGESVHGPH